MSNACTVVKKSIHIPSSVTHNTVSPFSSSLLKGPDTIIHVFELKGDVESPHVYVGAGTHGDELNGVRAVLEILDEITNVHLDGKLTLVPIQNPVGYLYRERLNPFDPIDPDWVHPGSIEGTYTNRVKHVLNEIAEKADCVIDLHTSGRGGSNNPMIYVPPENGNGFGEKSLELALAFGGDRIVFGENEVDYGWPVKNAMPFVSVRNGRMGFYAEAGRGGASVPEETYVNFFVKGVLNTLKALGVMQGIVEKQGEIKVVDPKTWEINVPSPIDGIFVPKTTLGSRVNKDEIIAEIMGITKSNEKVKASHSGLVTFINNYGSVSKGERLFAISE